MHPSESSHLQLRVESVSADTRIRQGLPLSPVLSNNVVDRGMKQALADYCGVQVTPNLSIDDLKFADDMVVLQPVLSRINDIANAVGLQTNTSKRKVL